ncbi:hypothetical protein Q7P37_003513 [Cladosporium fusiforme]
MSSPLAATMRKTADAFVAAWEELKTEPILAVRAPECIMTQRPASLGIPERDNESFRAWFAGVEGMLTNNKMTVLDYFASTEERRAFLHCTMTAERTDGSSLYENEYMFVLSFDEKGEKITKILEMVDSQRVREVWGHVREVEMKAVE